MQPAPTVTSLKPEFGPVGGGTKVTISGTDLTAVSAVQFGEVPATGFTVESESKIAAIAPPSAAVGAVDVTVTTLAGTSATSSSDVFDYEGCTVPKLKGKNLRSARRTLGRARCKLGKITRRKVRKAKWRGKVLVQHPKPGLVRPSATKVNVVIGK